MLRVRGMKGVLCIARKAPLGLLEGGTPVIELPATNETGAVAGGGKCGDLSQSAGRAAYSQSNFGTDSKCSDSLCLRNRSHRESRLTVGACRSSYVLSYVALGTYSDHGVVTTCY